MERKKSLQAVRAALRFLQEADGFYLESGAAREFARQCEAIGKSNLFMKYSKPVNKEHDLTHPALIVRRTALREPSLVTLLILACLEAPNQIAVEVNGKWVYQDGI